MQIIKFNNSSGQIKSFIVIAVFALFVLFGWLNMAFNAVDRFLGFGSRVFDEWRTISFIISLIFLIGIAYAITRLNVFLSKVRRVRRAEIRVFDIKKVPEGVRAERWEAVMSHLNSENPTDWKFAIMEADNIYDNLFAKMGYPGKGLGERLKYVEISDFKSLNDVWEAHKYRNRLVHEAATHQIDREEARRVIGLFENGLKELGYL